MASRVVLQVDQATSTHQVILWHIEERGQESDMDCGDGVRAGGGGQEATGHLGRPLHNFAVLSLTLFEKMPIFKLFSATGYNLSNVESSNQLILFE